MNFWAHNNFSDFRLSRTLACSWEAGLADETDEEIPVSAALAVLIVAALIMAYGNTLAKG
jgi:hypothetical protein